jgi:four helix bundle protein
MQKSKAKTIDQNSKNDFYRRIYLYTIKSLKLIGTINTKGDLVARNVVDQLIRSLTSIGANIIEAKACNSKKDFARYFDISLKSANETKFWLCILRDLNKADKTKLKEVLNETVEISNILGASLLTMRKKREVL